MAPTDNATTTHHALHLYTGQDNFCFETLSPFFGSLFTILGFLPSDLQDCSTSSGDRRPLILPRLAVHCVYNISHIHTIKNLPHLNGFL